MTKFGNKYGTTNAASSPVQSVGGKTVTNYGGASAYARDAKSDLFLLGVMNFVSEDTYYEDGQSRDNRFVQLVHQVTNEDPDWVERFIPWLRNEANMRSASVVAACEYVKAKGPNARKVIASAISRADEPAEVLAYWIGVHGKPVPSSVKRGVNDALARVWNEYSVAKYDGNSKTFRMGDVVNLTHPKPKDAASKALYKYTQDTRFNSVPDVSELPMLRMRKAVNAGEVTRDQLLADPELMKSAGMTWESLSGLGQMDAAAWEAVIPQMGYMALLRNLRNFEQAGVSPAVTQTVVARLADPEQVAKSRQLPFRFWSAYKNVNGLQWAYAIEQALGHSLANVPSLGGRTLLLVDTSASMNSATFSKNSTMTAGEAAAIFGAALALKGENVDWYGFADSPFKHETAKGESVLRAVEAFRRRTGETGHGTNIPGALAKWNGHDRVVLISDMQTLAGFEKSDRGYYGYGYQVDPRTQGIPENVPVFGFNLNGYATTQIGAKNSYELGGLTDHTFKLIKLIEQRQRGQWPF